MGADRGSLPRYFPLVGRSVSPRTAAVRLGNVGRLLLLFTAVAVTVIVATSELKRVTRPAGTGVVMGGQSTGWQSSGGAIHVLGGPLAGMPVLTRASARDQLCIVPAGEVKALEEEGKIRVKNQGRARVFKVKRSHRGPASPVAAGGAEDIPYLASIMEQHAGEIPGHVFFQTYWEPCVACIDEERVGRRGDGGKWICNAKQLLSHSSRVGGGACTMLSVGSNNDFTFEREVMGRWGCAVDVFDHTSEPPEYVSKGVFDKRLDPNQISSASSGELTFHNRRFDIFELLRYQVSSQDAKTGGRNVVDVFKIDCEGCEFALFHDPRAQRWIREHVGVLLIEVHWQNLDSMLDLRDSLYEGGMVTYHKEPNIMWTDGEVVEFAMVNKALVADWELSLPNESVN